MIHVERIPEPSTFDEGCRQPGKKWLRDWLDSNPGERPKRPRDFWTPFREQLTAEFKDRCGFGAMWISSGTVDHFVSWHEDEDMVLVYEWTNYRYVEGWVNSSKSKKTTNNILDPFDVQDGWFEIHLPSLQLKMTNNIPEEFREKAQWTLHNLPIQDDERILKTRGEWYRMYQEGELNLDGLRKKAPLIAAAVEKELERKMLANESGEQS